MTYEGPETWDEMIVLLTCQLPGMKEASESIDLMANQEWDMNKTSTKKDIDKAMELIQSEMQDRLEDLRGDSRFQLRIANNGDGTRK